MLSKSPKREYTVYTFFAVYTSDLLQQVRYLIPTNMLFLLIWIIIVLENNNMTKDTAWYMYKHMQ